MKGKALKMLLQVYTEVTILKSWLEKIFGPESNIMKNLIQDGDSEGYYDLLNNCLVARRHNVPPVQKIVSTKHVSDQTDLLLRIIERIKNRTASPENVMAFGFRMLSTDMKAMKTENYNVESFYPSDTFNQLRAPHFEKLLCRIGEEAMELLICRHSLFILIPPTSYLQLTGIPMYNLINTEQGTNQMPASKKQDIRKRKLPFKDDQMMTPNKLPKNSDCQSKESPLEILPKSATKCSQISTIFSDMPGCSTSATNSMLPKEGNVCKSRSQALYSTYLLNTPMLESQKPSANTTKTTKLDLDKDPSITITNLHKLNPNILSKKSQNSSTLHSTCFLFDKPNSNSCTTPSVRNSSKVDNKENLLLTNRLSVTPKNRNSSHSKRKQKQIKATFNACRLTNKDLKPLKPGLLAKDSTKKKTRRRKNRKTKYILSSCSLMKTVFNPYDFYQIIPHSYILYAKDLHQRFDKYQLLSNTNDLSDVSEKIFNGMFIKYNSNIQTEVSLQCDSNRSLRRKTGLSCSQPVSCTNQNTEGPSLATDFDCPKCQVKSFLASQVKHLLEKLVKKHRSCHYVSLLNYHCPLAVTKAFKKRKISTNQRSANFSKLNINLPSKSSHCVKVVKKLTSKRRKASIKMLIEDFVPHKQVYRFMRACLLRIIPIELLGSKHNMTVLLKNLKKLILLGKFEKICIGEIMTGMKVSSCVWLRKIPSLSWRCHFLCRCLVWIFFNIIMVIIRAFFYVTETAHYRNRLFYYRKPTWLHLRQLAIKSFLSKGMLRTIPREEVHSKMVKGDCLGVSGLRFLPKKKSLRPIINMNSSHLNLLSKKPPIKYQLSGIFHIFNHILEQRPEVMGYSVFGIDEIYEKWRTFVMERQQNKDQRPLYFVKIDIKECFNFINQKLLKIIMKKILEGLDEDFVIRKYARVFSNRGQLKRAFYNKAAFISEYIPKFKSYIQQARDKKKIGNSVFIDKVLYEHWDVNEILNRLDSHIDNNVVKLDSQYYIQTEGISQGSILSTILCNLYYGQMEKKMLQFDPDTLMMRMVDDFLLVTPYKSTAFRFLRTMLKGIPWYNCHVQPEKTLINFYCHHKTLGKIPQLLETEMLPWCGLMIDTKSLNVKRDYTRYSGLSISDILTVNMTPKFTSNLSHQILKCMNPKCLAIFLDKKINKIETIVWNLFNFFYLAACRFHTFIKRLLNKQRTLDNDQIFFKIIHCIADHCFKNVKRKMKQINSVETYPLARIENNWICFVSFYIKLSEHQSQYKFLRSLLKKFCLRGKDLLPKKRKTLLLEMVKNGPLENILCSMK